MQGSNVRTAWRAGFSGGSETGGNLRFRCSNAHRRWGAKLRRRLISIPAVGLSLVVWVLTAPLWFCVFVVMDGLNPGLKRRLDCEPCAFRDLFSVPAIGHCGRRNDLAVVRWRAAGWKGSIFVGQLHAPTILESGLVSGQLWFVFYVH